MLKKKANEFLKGNGGVVEGGQIETMPDVKLARGANQCSSWESGRGTEVALVMESFVVGKSGLLYAGD